MKIREAYEYEKATSKSTKDGSSVHTMDDYHASIKKRMDSMRAK